MFENIARLLMTNRLTARNAVKETVSREYIQPKLPDEFFKFDAEDHIIFNCGKREGQTGIIIRCHKEGYVRWGEYARSIDNPVGGYLSLASPKYDIVLRSGKILFGVHPGGFEKLTDELQSAISKANKSMERQKDIDYTAGGREHEKDSNN